MDRRGKDPYLHPFFPRRAAWNALAAGFIQLLYIPCLAVAQPQASVTGQDPVHAARYPYGNRQPDSRDFSGGIDDLRIDGRMPVPPGSPGLCFRAARNPARDSWTGMDKARHFTASFIITGAAAYWMKHKMNAEARPGLAAGMGFAFALGIAKEAGDMRKPGNYFSWKDLAADAAGVLAGSLLVAWW